MGIEKRLIEIWDKKYIQTLPRFIVERGFCYSINECQKDILITGINPSFRNNFDNCGSFGFDIQVEFQNIKYDNYWSPLKKMIYDNETNIDLRVNTAYLDIFYFREQVQKVLTNEILPNQDGIQFLVDQINLTQHVVEDIIKPKVIIVKNKESSVYWGKLSGKGVIWMGYDLELIENTITGELFRIKGLIDSNERIAPEIKFSNLEGTFVLFTQHINKFTKREKRPTAKFINELLHKRTDSHCRE